MMPTERFMRHHYGPSGFVSPNDLKQKESSMDKTERFEIMAELFRCSTGFLAPGKDVPPGIHSDQYEIDRRVAWGEWSDTKAVDMAIRFIQAQRKEAEEHARLYNVLEQSDTNQIMQERDALRLRIRAVDQEHEQIKAEREKMIQAHTPGPWTVKGVHVGPSKHFRAYSIEPNICEMNSSLAPDDVSANARLIAMAPEILLHLKDALSYIKNDCKQRQIPYCFTGADLAIAQAEGGAE